jgi:hypothetical protein
MKRRNLAVGSVGGAIILLLPVGAKAQLHFTAAQATGERAIQVQWQSKTNGVYRLEYAKELSGDIIWETLVDEFPAQGTNTIFLDTGKYWEEPALPHPKDDFQRYYRVVEIGTNSLPPPVVTITNLTAGTNLTGEVEIDAHIAATNNITFVHYYVDGEEVELGEADDDGNSSYTINTTEWPNGAHSIWVVAETTAGAESTGIPSTAQSGAGTSAKIPVTFDNYISKWYFSLPGFDPSLGETQRITAEFIAYSDWTLEIVDESDTTVRTASGSGNSMEFDWDGTDDNGFPTADGTYDFILTANQSSPMQNQSMTSRNETTLDPASGNSTEWLATPADGSGGVMPLALYPPGIDTNGLVIFEGSLADYRPKKSLAASSMTISSSSGSSSTSLYADTNQSTHHPRRPPPKPIKGSPGRFGVAWQGDHPDPGTNGIAGFNPPSNLSGNIQLSPNYLLPYGPIANAGNIADGFEKMMAKYKWKKAFNYGNDQVSAALLRKPSKGGQSLFNYCNIGLYIGHGIRGANQDFRATSTPSLQTYTPIYKKGVNAYDWVRLSEFDFGGGPGNLRWMGLYACNMLYYDNAQDMWNKGVLPMNPSLHILLAEETSIFMYPTFGRKWASYMNGGEPGGRRTIIDAWNLASRDIHSVPGVVPSGHTVIMTCAYWPNCVNDTLQSYTDNDSDDPSDILFRRVQVYP